MRSVRHLAVTVAMMVPLVAASRVAFAQNAASSNDEAAPIQITGEPTVATPAPPMTPPPAPTAGRLAFRGPSPVRPTVIAQISSDGDPVDIAILHEQDRATRDEDISYICRTPCSIPLAVGSYNLVARSPFGRVTRRIEVGRESRFVVTPRRSRALGYGLLIPGLALSGGGLFALVWAIESTAIYGSSTAYYRPDLTAWWVAGSLLSAAGLALLVPGVYLVRNASGHIRSEGEGAPATRPIALGAAVVPFGAGGAIGVLTATF